MTIENDPSITTTSEPAPEQPEDEPDFGKTDVPGQDEPEED